MALSKLRQVVAREWLANAIVTGNHDDDLWTMLFMSGSMVKNNAYFALTAADSCYAFSSCVRDGEG
jgi:hypothetical protein